ncbi:inactive protein RESTRICTED TEV MOVEMENT 2-like protein [Carex littledalei]|uniref:Inactive protein RESTRICTED TEV MOVEMENT 2-like protein n=1 Tax=Carex littledalei TaxID=544730 RepID=A0A833QS19_9POAL|nr:inactive protein RESTRICTED TEV MOVEMENT 2-like protein [Carex littledalei]
MRETGFKKEQIKVLIDNSGNLRVNGEHPLGENKWIRFRKDFQTTENCNRAEIRAKFENGRVYITLPKLVVDPVPPPREQPTQATAQDKKASEPKLPSTNQNEHSKLANGFYKDQIKVQIDNSGILRVNGKRPMGKNKWIRFRKDFQTTENLQQGRNPCHT